MNNDCLNMRHKRLDEKPCGYCTVCIANHVGHETEVLDNNEVVCKTCQIAKEKIYDWCGDRAYQVVTKEVAI